MDTGLEQTFELIMNAVSAEEVFGIVDVVLPPDEMLAHLKRKYEQLHNITSPENWQSIEDREAAGDADLRLKEFYQEAQGRIKAGLYGLGGSTRKRPTGAGTFTTGKREYWVGEVLADGDISTVYEGMCALSDGAAGEVVIKVVNDVEDNDLALNEIRILEKLHSQSAPQWKHLPLLLDSFMTDEGQQGIVLRKFRGFTLEQVRNHRNYREGVDRKHMVWMLNRTLSAIGYAHALGIVHCNITPDHIMVKPDDHNACILDWGYAASRPGETGDGFKVFTEGFSAPEVKEKKPPIPASDIYSIGKCMIYLLGGDVQTNEMPDSVELRVQSFLQWMAHESPLQRPQDAWELHPQLIQMIEELWGKRRFLHLSMD